MALAIATESSYESTTGARGPLTSVGRTVVSPKVTAESAIAAGRVATDPLPASPCTAASGRRPNTTAAMTSTAAAARSAAYRGIRPDESFLPAPAVASNAPCGVVMRSSSSSIARAVA